MLRFRKSTLCLACLVLAALVVGPAAIARADNGVSAKDVTGKFVSFQDGILTINVSGGKLAGTHSIPIADGLPLLFYATPGHPQTLKTPGGFANATKDMTTRVTIDTRMRVSRITLGDENTTKKSKKSSN